MTMDGGARAFLVTEEQLHAFARTVAREAVAAALSEVGSLLPPYSQHALPPDCRPSDFRRALAAGCPHRKRGRLTLVERADWTAYLAGPRTPPIEVTPQNLPKPANDAPVLDPAKLLEQSRATKRRG